MDAPLALGDVEIEIIDKLISVPYVEMTLKLMERFGVFVEHTSSWDRFLVQGAQKYKSPGKAYVEGDASSASYFLAGAAVTGGTFTVEGCGMSSLQVILMPITETKIVQGLVPMPISKSSTKSTQTTTTTNILATSTTQLPTEKAYFAPTTLIKRRHTQSEETPSKTKRFSARASHDSVYFPLRYKEEIILEVDGSVPTQPVLQHIGISAWPGRNEAECIDKIIHDNFQNMHHTASATEKYLVGIESLMGDIESLLKVRSIKKQKS